MAISFIFNEWNGTKIGSVGTTNTLNISTCNWKNLDDSVSPPETNPIVAGNNSYSKYIYGSISGAFNQISNGVFAHTDGVLGVGLTLKGTVSSTYATPATSTNGALTTDMTAITDIASGIPVTFSLVGPGSSGSSTVSSAAAAYTNFLITQLKTTGSASGGNTSTISLTIRVDEN